LRARGADPAFGKGLLEVMLRYPYECFLLGIAVTERQASFVPANPVLAISYATAKTLLVIHPRRE
jgi:hypothetical protein